VLDVDEEGAGESGASPDTISDIVVLSIDGEVTAREAKIILKIVLAFIS